MDFTDVTLGMHIDTLLGLHPNTEWVRKPTVLMDSLSKPKRPDLIVTYHYAGVDIVLERATSDDPMFGKITAYAVQKIIVRSDDEKHRKRKSKGRRKER